MPFDHPLPLELRTLRDWVRWGASRCREAGLHYGHGADNALDDVATLMLYSIGLQPVIPEPYWGAALTAVERERFLALLARRIDERLPVPYLVGEAWFCGLPFAVDRRVLIPRSPIAELIESGFEPWLQPGQPGAVLDLGTGSGCLAIACAVLLGDVRVDAVDLDADALAVAADNCRRHDCGDRVRLYQGDLYAALPPGRCYDLIVSNPPYVDREDMTDLPAEYRWEPEQALAAGDDGLDVVRRILHGAAERLRPEGILVVEVGNSADAVERLWPDLPFVWLEFQRGGHGVFLLQAGDLENLSGNAGGG